MKLKLLVVVFMLLAVGMAAYFFITRNTQTQPVTPGSQLMEK